MASERILEIRPEDLIRFMSKIRRYDSCWSWIGAKSPSGYGRFRLKNKTIAAHRFSFELFKNEISDNYQIDHLCKNTSCVNPNHLECVTQQVNIQRSLAGKLNNWNTKKTHCKRGHELNKDNLNPYKLKQGQRRCIKCINISQSINRKIRRIIKKDFLVI